MSQSPLKICWTSKVEQLLYISVLRRRGQLIPHFPLHRAIDSNDVENTVDPSPHMSVAGRFEHSLPKHQPPPALRSRPHRSPTLQMCVCVCMRVCVCVQCWSASTVCMLIRQVVGSDVNQGRFLPLQLPGGSMVPRAVFRCLIDAKADGQNHGMAFAGVYSNTRMPRRDAPGMCMDSSCAAFAVERS
jgi:hypothetical protein